MIAHSSSIGIVNIAYRRSTRAHGTELDFTLFFALRLAKNGRELRENKERMKAHDLT